jgi:hypothetical protein
MSKIIEYTNWWSFLIHAAHGCQQSLLTGSAIPKPLRILALLNAIIPFFLVDRVVDTHSYTILAGIDVFVTYFPAAY